MASCEITVHSTTPLLQEACFRDSRYKLLIDIYLRLNLVALSYVPVSLPRFLVLHPLGLLGGFFDGADIHKGDFRQVVPFAFRDLAATADGIHEFYV